MASRLALSDDVRDVIARSTITDTQLVLPGQLARPLYEKVAKVLDAAGGKWNRKAAAHVFPRDPREALGLAVETGTIVHEKKAKQQFFTPPGLAADIVTRADVRPGMRVLEPSAGEGALAHEIRAAGATVLCVEIDLDLVATLRANGFPTLSADFLLLQSSRGQTIDGLGLFDRVVMNPPFEKGQDIRHIEHALLFLKPGGRLLAVASAGVTFRSDKKTKEFRKLVASYGGTITPLPEDAFKESGTGVQTVLVDVRV